MPFGMCFDFLFARSEVEKNPAPVDPSNPYHSSIRLYVCDAMLRLWVG